MQRDGSNDDPFVRHYNWCPNGGARSDVGESKASELDHVARHYNWRINAGRNEGFENVGRDENSDLDTNSLHNWHFQSGVENNAENSKEMDFYVSVPTRRRQDGKDTGKTHREVINDENSDTDYQTSLEDQDDFRSTQTRHEQLPTQTTTSRSDFDIVEREQTPPQSCHNRSFTGS